MCGTGHHCRTTIYETNFSFNKYCNLKIAAEQRQLRTARGDLSQITWCYCLAIVMSLSSTWLKNTFLTNAMEKSELSSDELSCFMVLCRPFVSANVDFMAKLMLSVGSNPILKVNVIFFYTCVFGSISWTFNVMTRCVACWFRLKGFVSQNATWFLQHYTFYKWVFFILS